MYSLDGSVRQTEVPLGNNGRTTDCCRGVPYRHAQVQSVQGTGRAATRTMFQPMRLLHCRRRLGVAVRETLVAALGRGTPWDSPALSTRHVLCIVQSPLTSIVSMCRACSASPSLKSRTLSMLHRYRNQSIHTQTSSTAR